MLIAKKLVPGASKTALSSSHFSFLSHLSFEWPKHDWISYNAYWHQFQNCPFHWLVYDYRKVSMLLTKEVLISSLLVRSARRIPGICLLTQESCLQPEYSVFILGEVRAYIAANQQIADGLLEVIVKWNYRRKNIDDLRSGRWKVCDTKIMPKDANF